MDNNIRLHRAIGISICTLFLMIIIAYLPINDSKIEDYEKRYNIVQNQFDNQDENPFLSVEEALTSNKPSKIIENTVEKKQESFKEDNQPTWKVRLGTFKKRDGVDVLKDKLQADNFDAFVDTVNAKNGVFHILYVQGYERRFDIDKILLKLQKKTDLLGVVVKK